ncbi:MAG: hypothetical protein M1830_006663 [Pleopsidium flavum]|nr:MAG: hypothetical protein M1830_006663 [Pleopsidium flavum]
MASTSDSVPNPQPSSKEESSIHKLAKIIPRSKDLPWYQASYGSRLTPETRNLLEHYAHVPPSEIEAHIYKIRDAAWTVFPFPCIGEFWFLTLGLSAHPRYNDLLARVKSASDKTRPLLIDLGTCLGQDLRKLVYDGAAPTQLLGVDVFPDFEAVGHDFFRDADRFAGRFVAADIFSTADSALARTKGTWDVVASCMFLHSFDWAGQVAACKKMVELAAGPGSWIMGGMTANVHAREQVLKPPFVPEGVKRSVFMHSKESFGRLWDEVKKDTRVEVKVWAEYEEGESESKEANEQGAGNLFGNSEQKLLWYMIEML